jgi:hypothetical protein
LPFREEASLNGASWVKRILVLFTSYVAYSFANLREEVRYGTVRLVFCRKAVSTANKPYFDDDWSAISIAPSLPVPVNQQELRSQSSLLSWDIMAKEGLLMECPGYG